MTYPDGIPSREELITQAVNGDIVRIIMNDPPEPLRWAKRLEITRRALAWVTALSAGACVSLAFTLTSNVTITVVTVCLALIYLATWAAAIVYGRRSRIVLLRKYGIAPNRDGVFELLRAGQPHEDLAATREMLRVHPAVEPPARS